jgi:hypothetical protein
MITTQELWSHSSYAMRRALLADTDLVGVESAYRLTIEQISVVPWNDLPRDIRHRIHDETTCHHMEGV